MDRIPSAGGHDDHALIEALGIAQRLGVIGATELSDEIAHARGFVTALEELSTGSLVLDIGSGGGLPGLVIAHDRPDVSVTLVDRREKRTDILRRQVGRLRVDRPELEIVVKCADVTDHSALRGLWHAVTARSFGSPEVVLAAAAPHLVDGGLLVVSDPPGNTSVDRWRTEILTTQGFERSMSPTTAPWVSVMRRRHSLFPGKQ
jgi:16S rRNA (guanine527-N7)-methyltransferase